MSDIIAETASDIKTMRIRGAGRIARAGASALGQFAQQYVGSELEEFLFDLENAKKDILASRPTAVSLWNGVRAATEGVKNTDSLESAKNMVVGNADAFVKKSKDSAETIAKIGAKRIVDGDVIITHCNSSAAVGIMKEAHRQGKKFKVYATESRPWRQGIITVNELADAGIDVTLIIDSCVRTVMAGATKVFVGADTVTSEGSLINKIGTSQVALAAHEASVPFYVCTETYKFSPKTIFGETVNIEDRGRKEVVPEGEIRDSVKVMNPVFDTTPAKYITAIITEDGIMPPSEVYNILRNQLKETFYELRD